MLMTIAEDDATFVDKKRKGRNWYLSIRKLTKNVRQKLYHVKLFAKISQHTSMEQFIICPLQYLYYSHSLKIAYEFFGDIIYLQIW